MSTSVSSMTRAPRSQRKRFVRRPPDLTSLFDVLFIVVFVALIRAAAAEQALAKATEPPPKPAPVVPVPAPLAADIATLRTRAVANLHEDIDARTPIVIRIAAKPVQSTDPDASLDARIEAIEVGGKRIALDTPLLERDPRVNIAYLGDRSAELRLCKIAMTRANLPDLGKHFVIVAPTLPLRELPRALTEGLNADVARCSDLRGLASLVDPAALPEVDPKSGATGSSSDPATQVDAISKPTNLPLNHPSRHRDSLKKTDP